MCIENKVNFDSPYKWLNSRRDAVRRLVSLRLVNRGFCASASPQLFRHIVAIGVPFQKESPLVRLVEISRSPFAVYVQRIDVGLQFLQNSSVESLSSYVEDLAGVLPGCLSRLPNIKAFGFYGTPSSLPWEITRVATNTIIAALRYGQLLNLTELEVTLPTAPEFGQLFGNEVSTLGTPIEHTLEGIRHLGLHVDGKSNPYTRSDQTHTVYLFRLIELAVNVTSLAISGDSLLSLTNFQFIPPLCLKSLDLNGVETSARVLTSLIEQSKESIRSIRFCRVTIDSGGWESIFRRVSRLQHLLDVDIGSCGYTFTAANQGLGASTPCPPAWPQAILSQNVNDGWTLRNLLLQVNTNRIAAGLPVMPESPYKCSYWASPYGPYGMRDSPSTRSSIFS